MCLNEIAHRSHRKYHPISGWISLGVTGCSNNEMFMYNQSIFTSHFYRITTRCIRTSGLKPTHRPILQSYDTQELLSANASMLMFYSSSLENNANAIDCVPYQNFFEWGNMTYDNTRSLLTERSHHYFFSFIIGPMRLKAFSARCAVMVRLIKIRNLLYQNSCISLHFPITQK